MTTTNRRDARSARLSSPPGSIRASRVCVTSTPTGSTSRTIALSCEGAAELAAAAPPASARAAAQCAEIDQKAEHEDQEPEAREPAELVLGDRVGERRPRQEQEAEEGQKEGIGIDS